MANYEQWRDDRRLVLHEIERLNSNMVKIQEMLAQQHTEIVTLKTESATWGAVTGFIASAFLTLVSWFVSSK